MHGLFRSLIHYRKANAAVTLGAAVAATVLTGALLAGDSVRGSLRALTLGRLGGVDEILVGETFFREALAQDLAPARVAPAILLRGSAVHAASHTRATGVAVYGVDSRFAALHGVGELPDLAGRGPGQLFPSLAVNASLARELGAQVGDDVLLSLPRPDEIPRETLIGDKDVDDVLISRRFTLVRIVPDRGLGGFALSPHQAQPKNAFVSLAGLQDAVGRQGKVNVLLAAGDVAGLPSAVQAEDLGLRFVRGEGLVSVESEGFFVKPTVAEAVAQATGAPPREVLTYLATRMSVGQRLLPYSMVAGLASIEGLTLGEDEIALSRWAAEDLQAKAGDALTMTYLVIGPGGGLVERQASFRVAGTVEMSGLGADRTLTPTFPGLDEAEDIAAWDPPFPVDLSLIRPQDEAYWDEHGPAPKAFVAFATAQRLWSTRFGNLTALRLAAADPAGLEQTLRRELPRRVALEAFGLTFRAVKSEGVKAASGSTDFSGLFIGFSLFLIAAAVLLVGLLFSLAVEQRAAELGLLLAVGYPVRTVRRRLLGEGLILAGAGALLGLLGALGYAALLMAGLRTWWRPAVGTSELSLHVAPASLATGWAISVVVVLAAVWWSVRRLARLPSPALLAGVTRPQGAVRPGRAARWVALGGGLAAAGLLAWAVLSGETSSPALSFGVGASLLVAGLALISARLKRPRPVRHVSLPAMAARNGGANPGRSLLSVALVASACFVLVTVAANRRSAPSVEEGAGGYRLLAESTVPLVGELPDAAIVALRMLPGDDASCLNLFRPGKPRLLGVDPAVMAARSFHFREGGWDLLGRDLGADVIPALADEASATWILKLGLGDDLTMTDEAGRPVKLRLVGLLERSLFQSELLVAQDQLLRHFPTRAGRSFFLIDAPEDRLAQVTQSLEDELGRFGFDVSSTADRLAAFQAVESTYLSTFQALGGFGLLLGTLGLGLALLRGVIERRGELATLRACGFPRRLLGWLVTAENGFLVLSGVGLGTVAGLVAVGPHLLAGRDTIPWLPLLATLAAVVAVGLLSSLAAVASVVAAPLLPVLKEEP